MKTTQYLFSLMVSLVLVACAGTGALLLPGSTPALQGITGIDALMGAPCASANYFRVAPHICKVQGNLTATSLGPTLDNTCRALDFNAAYSLPTSATFLGFYEQGCCAATLIHIETYKEVGCTTLVDTLTFPLSTGFQNTHFQVPIFGGQWYYKSLANYVATCGANCLIKPTHYYD